MPVRVRAVSAHVGPYRLTMEQVEDRIAAASPGFRVPRGVLGRMSGVQTIHHCDEGTPTSQLAAAAAEATLEAAGLEIGQIDLLLFASASQDMVEPATSHIVAARLGATCPVMDVKNACNSWLNGVEVAEALIAAGRYHRVLVCTGERPSAAARWQVRDFRQFAESVPGYTMSDAGAAGIVEVCEPGARGEIVHRWFTAASQHWDVGTLPGGGSIRPHDPEATYFVMDGVRLREAFDSVEPQLILDALAADGSAPGDVAALLVHQVALGYLEGVTAALHLDAARVVVSLPEYGNCASASLPLQWQLLERGGGVEPGELVLLLGLGGGISVGTMGVRW